MVPELTAQDWLDLAEACLLARNYTPTLLGFRSPIYWRALRVKCLMIAATKSRDTEG